MRSITNKIALMLIIALTISFAAISVVSYYTAESRVVQLVSQNQAQILKDINEITDLFFKDYTDVIKKISTNVQKTQYSEDELLKTLILEKDRSNSVVG